MPAAAEIVVNATSIGLFPDVDAQLDLDFETLGPGMLVADIIPNPPRTRLIVRQRSAAARFSMGWDAGNQGVIGIKYWTGVDVDAAVMRRTLLDLFEPS